MRKGRKEEKKKNGESRRLEVRDFRGCPVYSFILHGPSLVRARKLAISTRQTGMEQSVTAQKGGMYFEHDSVVSMPTYKFRNAKFCTSMCSHKLQKKKK